MFREIRQKLFSTNSAEASQKPKLKSNEGRSKTDQLANSSKAVNVNQNLSSCRHSSHSRRRRHRSSVSGRSERKGIETKEIKQPTTQISKPNNRGSKRMSSLPPKNRKQRHENFEVENKYVSNKKEKTIKDTHSLGQLSEHKVSTWLLDNGSSVPTSSVLPINHGVLNLHGSSFACESNRPNNRVTSQVWPVGQLLSPNMTSSHQELSKVPMLAKVSSLRDANSGSHVTLGCPSIRSKLSESCRYSQLPNLQRLPRLSAYSTTLPSTKQNNDMTVPLNADLYQLNQSGINRTVELYGRENSRQPNLMVSENTSNKKDYSSFDRISMATYIQNYHRNKNLPMMQNTFEADKCRSVNQFRTVERTRHDKRDTTQSNPIYVKHSKNIKNNDYAIGEKSKDKTKTKAKTSSNKLLGTLSLLGTTKPKVSAPLLGDQIYSAVRKDLNGSARKGDKFESVKQRIEQPKQGGERVGWEYHNITLSRVPVYGFGIAVSGGRDNPHFVNGDPSIAISDVLKAGPAEGRLMVNDRVISANGISLENVDYNQAIQVLRECGNTVNLLIKRRALVSQSNGSASNEPNNNFMKISLTKANKKDDFGIVLGCKIFVKEISNRTLLNDKDVQEGDIIHKINNTNTDNMTLKEARKLLESCKEKVSLVISRDAFLYNNIVNNRFLSENGNYINGLHRNNSSVASSHGQPHQRYPSNGFENPPPAVAKDNIYNSHNDVIQSNSNAVQNAPNGNNSSIAAMASGRQTNGWSNQNLYVQPPTRADINSNNVQNIANVDASNDCASATRNRGPITDISLSQLDQPATPVLVGHSRNVSEVASAENPQRPLPQKPSQVFSPNSIDIDATKINAENDKELEAFTKPKHSKLSDIRYISFQKEGSVGIRLTGGNEVGIFVTAVQPGSPASVQGLQVGDKILKANSTDMKGFTREEAVLFLLKIQDKIDLVVQNCNEEYEDIVANQKGDSFYIRVHFNYDSEGKGELSFHCGDVFHVVDTLFNGVVGSWFVYRLGRNNQEIQKGSIPNKSRADELAIEQNTENRSKKSFSGTDLNTTEGSSRRVNFFKRRRSARRSKSLCKEHWEDVVFGDCKSKFAAYERVTLKHTGFTRPVVFFGPLSDIAREKLLKDYPDKFASPQALDSDDDGSSKRSKLSSSGIVRLSSIKQVVESGKHALLDITPSAVDRLNYAQFYPIVIFMRAENKAIVKELRSRSSSKSTVHRSSRKLFEQSLKLEKLWHHVFTSSITLTSGGDLWYKKLRETIEKQQSQNIWMAESKPEENISDDFLFPMISRLSYASSPESDLDISANDSRLDDTNEENEKRLLQHNANTIGNRLIRSSSDPSLAPGDETVAVNISQPLNQTGTLHSFSQNTDNDKIKPNKNDNENSSSNSTISSNQRSPNKNVPLHILLRKELSKALNYDSKDKENSSKANKVSISKNEKVDPNENQDPSNYPTLKAGEQYPQESSYPSRDSDSPLPPPPPTTLPPSTTNSKVQLQQQYLEAPPRIDRNSKPSRFRSAHERLFGSKSSPPTSAQIYPTNGNYQYDDSDYINTSAPVKYEASVPDKQVQPNNSSTTNGTIQPRYVTGAFGDTSSYSSDSYNKYSSQNSTLETKQGSNYRPGVVNNDPYRFTRSTVQPLSHNSTLSSKHSSLERNKPLPPPPPPVRMEPNVCLTSTFAPKAPPSPPPKPAYKYGGQPLHYQMNSMSLGDNRPPPPPKPPTYPAVMSSSYNSQSDYDNMPPIYPVNPANKQRPTSFHNSFDISNGPPGYYQSLPQSSFSYQPKENVSRYSTTANINSENIPNFINGAYPIDQSSTSYNPVRKDRPGSRHLEMNGESQLNNSPHKQPLARGMSPSKGNYDNIRYNPSVAPYLSSTSSSMGYNQQQHLNNGPYLNVPYPSKTINSDLNNSTYLTNTNAQSSPLPPPPPLPSYNQLPSANQNLVQPTPQQPQSGQYLDLSLNRENRGSAFEAYRKPGMDSMRSSIMNDSQMFHGLPPPPPPLSVADFNHVNYTNIDEISSSTLYTRPNGCVGGGMASATGAAIETNVIATASGIFGPEGGSLVSSETGVSVIIPPGAIPDGVSQEIYFKVCEDKNMAPPLDREKGETLLSPIVMCGPHGLRFNIPIELRLPHCAIVNPESWSFALKSSDTSNGEPAGWRNVSMNGERDGITGNNFNEEFVSVLVDHF